MSLRGSRPQPRRVRRQRVPEGARVDPFKLELPGPLRILQNPWVFLLLGGGMAAAIIFSLLPGIIGSPTRTGGSDGPIRQANELADVSRDEASLVDIVVPTPVDVKRYTQPPALVIDSEKHYVATITTPRGEITLELYPKEAPEAVNAFVFLAQDGYYDGTPFMELVKQTDGSRFYTQAGDPTRTGLGSPGFSIKKELTSLPFDRGAVGMGGSAANSNGGQFFISFVDVPALDGKYTIFGQVVEGLDILDGLSLLDLSNDGAPTGAGDAIESIVITES